MKFKKQNRKEGKIKEDKSREANHERLNSKRWVWGWDDWMTGIKDNI